MALAKPKQLTTTEAKLIGAPNKATKPSLRCVTCKESKLFVFQKAAPRLVLGLSLPTVLFSVNAFEISDIQEGETAALPTKRLV